MLVLLKAVVSYPERESTMEIHKENFSQVLMNYSQFFTVKERKTFCKCRKLTTPKLKRGY